MNAQSLCSFIYGLYHETSITRVKYGSVKANHLNNWASSFWVAFEWAIFFLVNEAYKRNIFNKAKSNQNKN